MDEVAEVELGGALGTGQLHAQLLVGVVEDELVVALGLARAAAELGALEAAQGCWVAVALRVGAGAVPGGAGTGDGVALGAGAPIGGLGVDAGVAGLEA